MRLVQRPQTKIAIYGAGGCGRDIYAMVERKLQGVEAVDIVFVDDAMAGTQMCNRPVIAAANLTSDWAVLIAVADGHTRHKLAAQTGATGFISATSLISELAAIGQGAVISDHVTIGPRATIGVQFQANYYSYVAHDCKIGDYVTFGPRVNCNGDVTIGDFAYIGSNASIRQGVVIGANAIVGMGAIVVEDVPEGVTVMGNPAKIRSDYRKPRIDSRLEAVFDIKRSMIS
jgi:sugar O-acyltransferase (sialic acid O-acetyltransferase NeuD family)